MRRLEPRGSPRVYIISRTSLLSGRMYTGSSGLLIGLLTVAVGCTAAPPKRLNVREQRLVHDQAEWHSLCEFDPDSVTADRDRDLARSRIMGHGEIMGQRAQIRDKINGRDRLLSVEGSMDQGHRMDARGDAIEGSMHALVARVAGLQPEQARDHRQFFFTR